MKFKLEGFRANIEENLEARLGARLAMGTVSVNGFRGIRIDDLTVRFALEEGPHMELATPLALININLNDLFYGGLKVERIILNESEITLTRPPESDWFDPQRPSVEPSLNFERTQAFRITGRDCRLRVENVVGGSSLEIEDFTFDISRLEEANQLAANVSGYLSGERDKHLGVKLTATSREDFDLRVETRRLTAEDVNVVFPASQDFVESGETQATLWINGRPGDTVVVSVHALFEDLTLREQPEFIDPAEGMLTLLAYYETESNLLTLASARADSHQVAGELEGTIDFSQAYPFLDLRLDASKIPSRDILNYIFENTDNTYGHFDLALAGDQSVYLEIEGTTEEPVMIAAVAAETGELMFDPTDENLPRLALDIADLEARWNPAMESPLFLSCAVIDGEVVHDELELRAEQLYGAIALENGVLRADPIKGVVRESTIVGSAVYELESGDADATYSGTVPGLEKTFLSDAIKHTRVAGAASIQGKVRKRGRDITAEATLDATQANIDYQWWLSKPPGVGASGEIVAELNLDTGVTIYYDCEVASTELDGDLHLARSAEGRWALKEVRASSDYVDINSVAKCLKLPYTLTGGTGTDAHFNWKRVGPGRRSEQTMGMRVDVVEAVPTIPDSNYIIRATDAILTAQMESEVDSQAFLQLAMANAEIPALGETWIVPLKPPPEYPNKNRTWNFDLRVGDIRSGEWRAREFRGIAYTNAGKTGFEEYSAKVGQGYVSGNYHMEKEHNTFTSRIRWQNIPAETMLAHLGYPETLRGNITGEIDYAMDRDDPATLRGEGSFDIRQGEFGAEFLYSLIRGQMEEDFVSLPSSLAFERLKTTVALEGDRVETTGIELDSEAFKLAGDGSYFRDGDMDYMISVRIAPATAQEIPLIAEYFNLDGHRLARQDLNLGFRITGPTFNPTGTLAELPPASVTLVSGALEVATEAVRIIDLPRRILLDLVKTGGGIVGT